MKINDEIFKISKQAYNFLEYNNNSSDYEYNSLNGISIKSDSIEVNIQPYTALCTDGISKIDIDSLDFDKLKTSKTISSIIMDVAKHSDEGVLIQFLIKNKIESHAVVIRNSDHIPAYLYSISNSQSIEDLGSTLMPNGFKILMAIEGQAFLMEEKELETFINMFE